MRHVGNRSAIVPHLAEELYRKVQQHQDGSAHREHAENKDDSPRIDHGEKQHQGI